ncbi:hypothetical protein RIF29_24788 [Crotalaria pallida]|uniref:Uncharacterized protein n=1 Tax=Crotalaria pallida TaxID=3830 RepID=A0AAN9ESM4_CROPI
MQPLAGRDVAPLTGPYGPYQLPPNPINSSQQLGFQLGILDANQRSVGEISWWPIKGRTYTRFTQGNILLPKGYCRVGGSLRRVIDKVRSVQQSSELTARPLMNSDLTLGLT